MNKEIPQDLPSYFRAHPEQFVLKGNTSKKIINGVLFAIVLGLMIYPEITPAGELWIWRIIAGIGMVYTGFSIWLGSDFYNKQTQTKIVQASIKKFDSSATTEKDLIFLLENENFRELANIPSKDNQPLQLYVYEDVAGKAFYLLLMKYFSSSDFRGITPVKIISGAEYDKHKPMIQALK